MTIDRIPGAEMASGSAVERGLRWRLNRRRLLFGLAAVGLPAMTGCRGEADAPAVEGRAALAAGTDLDVLDAPTATPSPAPQPTASPTPSPEPTGLEIVRDQRPTYDAEPVAGGHLRLFSPQEDLRDFSPVAFRQDFQVLASYLDPLVWIDEVTMEPKPWLAERWAWGADGKSITFTLRPGVRWHDGEPLRARDVVFSLFVARDDVDSAVRNLFTEMDFAEAIGDDQVKVTLTTPDGGWLLNASTLFVVPRHQYTDYWQSRPEGQRTLTGFDWRLNAPVGTGPWQIDERGRQAVAFTRNEQYWAEPPHFERLTIASETDPAERVAAWKRGDVDVVWPVRSDDLSGIEEEPGRLYAADAAAVMFAAFNFDNPARAVPDLFGDVRVRQALSLAIDREGYAREVFGGFHQPDRAGTVAQPWAHDDGVVNPARDVAAARDLLRAAGWEDRDGDGVAENAVGAPLELIVIARNDSRPELVELLKQVAEDLTEIGVALKVTPLAPDRFRQRWMETRDYDLIAYAYNLFPGFTDFDLYGSAWDIRVNPQGWNPGGYQNPDVDEAIAEALVAVDLEDQAAALRRLQRVADEDLFGLWFGFPQDLILVRPDVLGFQPNKLWQTWDTRKLWRAPR